MSIRVSGSAISLAAFLVLAVAVPAPVGCRNNVANRAADGTTDEDGELPGNAAETPPMRNVGEAYVKRLVDDGWPRSSAEAVVELNAEWFDIQADENPAGLKLQLKLLGGLGEHAQLHDFLINHPECAGLLAASGNPVLIAESLRAAFISGEYHRVAGLYVQHANPRDATDIALALKANRDLICMLLGRGLLGCEVIFVFDRTGPDASEYDMWLRETLSVLQPASEDELASFANLVMRHGAAIRERMRTSEDFRQRFRTELWPKLARVVGSEHGAFEYCLDDLRIWDLLALDNGEELLRRCGLLPIDLLYGYPEIDHPPYPESLHDRIIQILLRREELAIHSLMRFRREPQFHRLLERNLSPDTRSAVLTQLLKSCPNHPEKLALYERLSDKALAEEVGPPPTGIITWVPFYYTLYEVPKKRLQGREPTGMDLFSAAVDPVFLVVDIFTAGQSAVGRKVLVAGGKEAAEQAAKEIAEKGAEKLLVTTLRDTGLELAKKRVGKEVAEKMTEKELVAWSISGTLSQMQQAIRSTAGKATTFEVTKPVQFMFRYSGVGRETWKRWTGMEARLFMRGDAKVFVRIGNLPAGVIGTRSAAYLNRTAQDLSLGALAESEPGQEVLHSALEQGMAVKDHVRSWQQNVSAWWLLNSGHVETGNAAPRE